MVSESRPYAGWSQVSGDSAMVMVRRELSRRRTRLAREGFTEMFVAE